VESFLEFAKFYWHSEISQWTQRKERIERIPKSIWKVKRQDYKLTDTHFSKKRLKI